MTAKIKSAFAAIRAEEALKATTLFYLKGAIQKGEAGRRRSVRCWAAALASLVFLLFTGVTANYLYARPAAYVDVDVNPAVGFTLNRFDRVVAMHGYTETGALILAGLDLKHKSCAAALTLLLESMCRGGYITDEGLLSVTLQAADTGRERALLAELAASVAAVAAARCPRLQTDIFPVDAVIRSQSQAHDISPAKYLAIRELMALDPAASLEGCRGHSISEIQRAAAACRSRGGAESDSDRQQGDHGPGSQRDSTSMGGRGCHGGHG